ncbi:MAG: class I SAM-dependent methyltransferase [Acidimicrobiia bacterium]|nr:class I SAM-dependent methyltransferase [Acidimicrobiia bacterium]
MTRWDGGDYQGRFDALAASGEDVHGEADLVWSLGPSSVLDAGCGTGRVAIELARRRVEVVGADVDASMLATARRLAPDLAWVHADLTELDLGRTFDVVVLAGNVPLFTPAGTEAALIGRCAAHVGAGGALLSGFQLGRGYEVADLDAHASAAGLTLTGRWSTWDREQFPADGAGYAVSLHRRSA